MAKYTESGDLLWATTFGEGSDDIGFDVAPGSSGDVVVTGYAATPDGLRIFLARFDAAGTQLWQKRLGPSEADAYHQQGHAVALDGAGNVFLLAGDPTAVAVDGSGGIALTGAHLGSVVRPPRGSAAGGARRRPSAGGAGTRPGPPPSAA